MKISIELLIPILGTSLGSALVFLVKGGLNKKVEKALLGFAGGVMTAASIWSLLDPSIELSADMGKLAFLPAVIGFLVGIGFLLLLDVIIPHIHKDGSEEGKRGGSISKTTKMLLAVTLHNIPEGLAVGVVLAGSLNTPETLTFAGALSLAIGIAIQNFPEGAVISMPLYIEGNSKKKSFLLGTLSGVVEPLAAGLTLLIVNLVIPALPYLLAFAAGAMIYVVVEELVPESQEGGHSNIATICFSLGFVIMMILDIALG